MPVSLLERRVVLKEEARPTDVGKWGAAGGAAEAMGVDRRLWRWWVLGQALG